MTATASLDHTSKFASALAKLTEKIEAARARALVLGLGEAGLWGLAAGLVVVCVGHVARIGLMDLNAAAIVAAALVVGLAVGALTAFIHLLRRPGMLAVARRADGVFSTDESLSTALELAFGNRPAGPFDRLVIARANAAAERVTPQALFPGRMPRPALPVLCLGLVAIVLAGFPANEAVTPPAAAFEPVIDAREQAALAVEIESVARSLAEDANDRVDTYIASVANELLAVSRDLASGTRRDRRALLSGLDQLRSHAAAGYAEAARVGAIQDRSTLLDPVIEAVRAPAPSAATPPAPAAPAREGEGEGLSSMQTPLSGNDDRGGEAEVSQQGGPAAQSGQRSQGDVPERVTSTDAPCLIDGEESCMAPRDSNYLLDRATPVSADPESVQAVGATPGTGERPERGEGLLVGPATQSGKGDSTQAGRGSEPLLGEDPEEAVIALGEHLVLANERRAVTGPQTRVDRAPSPGQYEIADLPPADISAWRQSPESPTAQNSLPPARRDVLTRYFAVAQE